jgi:hypothetical protein
MDHRVEPGDDDGDYGCTGFKQTHVITPIVCGAGYAVVQNRLRIAQ